MKAKESENAGNEAMSKENREPRGGGRKEQDHLARAGSGQCLELHLSSHSLHKGHLLSCPNKKKNWLYWTIESRATIVTVLGSTEDSEVVSHSSPSQLQSSQSNTSNHQPPNTSTRFPCIPQQAPGQALQQAPRAAVHVETPRASCVCARGKAQRSRMLVYGTHRT